MLKMLYTGYFIEGQICHFSVGAPRIPKINEFYTWDMGNERQIKINKLEYGHFTLSIWVSSDIQIKRQDSGLFSL